MTERRMAQRSEARRGGLRAAKLTSSHLQSVGSLKNF
jgi:hypothetical protein